ncbi:hypothetical protein B1R32_101178 [Abditibacterium utsteinense]|uniref:Uncharacterized protein n=1 Tax=Abditibacterium utsteinense TaxID=1960156 RepID=A0A2S8SXC2_9BACT|nr:alkaline phosphatase PhoX [Abditibacterium utsteinense]PQV65436.1 hypothetical protein B1R32_101178 [Abditibacterium utsteinense]
MLTRKTILMMASLSGCSLSAALLGGCGGGGNGSGGLSGATKFSQFTALTASSPSTSGGNAEQPLVLPAGYSQTVLASEPQFPDLSDMNTLSETGPQTELYRTHEGSSNGAVTATNLASKTTRIVAQRADWERFDGISWTPWGTLIAAEETSKSAFPDPAVPEATAGLVYEINPQSGQSTVRPAIGSRAHEGLRFDGEGNLYGISETSPGYIYKFTSSTKGSLAAGQLYALKITESKGDRVGAATWIPLDAAAVRVNSDAAAQAAGATGYNRPEDVECSSSPGTSRGGGNILYVAVTGPGDNRVLAIDLKSGGDANKCQVRDYVRVGLNAPADFEMPDNLTLDPNGNLYVAEDPGGLFSTGKIKGDDVWFAPRGTASGPAGSISRFATLTDSDAEPTGIYFDRAGTTLFVSIQHRGGDGLDKTMMIKKTG